MASLDDDLSCSACLERYDDTKRVPKTLVCFHTFCNPCLNKLITKNSITCPTCQEITKDTKDFVTNFALLESISVLNGPKSIQCDFCADECKATHKCESCEKLMCAELVAFHIKKTKHTVECLVPKKTTFMCEKHPSKEIELVCSDDGSLICVLCATTSHRERKAQTIDEVFPNEQKGLETLVNNANTHLQKINGALQLVQDKETEVEEICTQTSQELKNHFDQIKSALNAYEASMTEKFRQLRSTKKDILQKQSSHLENTAKGIISAIKQMESIQKYESPLAILVMKQRLNSFVTSLNKIPLKPEVEDGLSILSDLQFLDPLRNSIEICNSTEVGDFCTIEGNGLKFAFGCQVSSFRIITRGKHAIFSVESEVNCSLVDKKNGTCEVEYTAPSSLTVAFIINILCNGKPLKGSPFRVPIGVRWHDNWTLQMSSQYGGQRNTKEALLNDPTSTGAATDQGIGQYILATFPSLVSVNFIEVSGLSGWGAFYINDCEIQYINSDSHWERIMDIRGAQDQTISKFIFPRSILASGFRLIRRLSGYVATGYFRLGC